ncbi:MAG: hypothetical protein OSB58_05780 [Alphaproteobacteria bacterium]|jgi:hypothetical protein|nr:hypothetical protein [Alphaproteobacteria bacterium]
MKLELGPGILAVMAGVSAGLMNPSPMHSLINPYGGYNIQNIKVTAE